MAQQTSVEWLEKELYIRGPIGEEMPIWVKDLFEQAKQTERERRKEDVKIGYNQGYLDSQCNHINDADNFANELNYLQDENTSHL